MSENRPTKRRRFASDFTLENHGSIVLLKPNKRASAKWLTDTAPEDAQFFGNALAIEPRYVSNVIEAARADRFNIQGGMFI